MADTKRRGRPRSDNRASEVIKVNVTPAQKLDLRRVAVDNGMRVASVIREAVNEFVSDYGERQIFSGRKKSG